MTSSAIDIIPSHHVDKEKWNTCIRNSSNSLIYASYDYLNHLCDNWSAIIIDDYRLLMPIPWRKKFGICYTYQVPFIQQLGFFGEPQLLDKNVFLTLFKFCKYGDYFFNYDTGTSLFSTFSSKTNFIIDLSQDFASIEKNYKNDFIQNLRKAERSNLQYKQGNWEKSFQLYKQQYSLRLKDVSENNYNNFFSLCKSLEKKQMIFSRDIVDANNESLLATGLFLKDDRRIYNIMNSTTEEGRKTEANHLLFDSIFEEFAGSKMLFDFEGSDLPGVKSFYQKTGAINQPYYHLHFNHLPVLIKWLKK